MKRILIIFLMSLMISFAISFAQESPSIFSKQIGNYQISLLSEVQQTGNTSILIGATDEMLKSSIPDGTFPNAMNAFLIKTPDKNILFDTGLGKKLFQNLESLNINPEEIDIIFITHMHGDHIGGMLRDEKQAFPNAHVYLPKPEHDYWNSIEKMNSLPENKRNGFINAQKVIEAYKKQLHLFDPEELNDQKDFLIPGIHGIAAYGHTPGHSAFIIESANEKLLIWGDVAHAMAIQMPYPQVAVTYDVNPEDAIEARKSILEYVSINKIPVAGMHIAFPAMGIIEKQGKEGYRFIPFK